MGLLTIPYALRIPRAWIECVDWSKAMAKQRLQGVRKERGDGVMARDASPFWQFDFWHRGTQVRGTTGELMGTGEDKQKSYDRAVAKAKAKRAEIDQRLAGGDEPPVEEMTLAEAIIRYTNSVMVPKWNAEGRGQEARDNHNRLMERIAEEFGANTLLKDM